MVLPDIWRRRGRLELTTGIKRGGRFVLTIKRNRKGMGEGWLMPGE